MVCFGILILLDSRCENVAITSLHSRFLDWQSIPNLALSFWVLRKTLKKKERKKCLKAQRSPCRNRFANDMCK